MACIKSHDTDPEIYIRKMLYSKGYRFRVNHRSITGVPDLFFSKKKVAMFVHGCFWHRHTDCQYAYMPKTNVLFWQAKFKNNINRDQAVITELLDKKIRCLIIWECTIRRMQKKNETWMAVLSDIEQFINNDQMMYLEL